MPFFNGAHGAKLHVYEDDFLYPWQHPTPVILCHGFARNGIFWKDWVPKLGGERRVYRPDVRGFGQSALMPDNYVWNVEDMLADIVAMLDHFKMKKVHWVGESSGGESLVLRTRRARRAVASERGREIGFRKLLRHRQAVIGALPDSLVQRLGDGQHAGEPLAMRQPIAARKQQAAKERYRLQEESPARGCVHGFFSVRTS